MQHIAEFQSSTRIRRTDSSVVRLALYAIQMILDLSVIAGSFFIANVIRNGSSIEWVDMKLMFVMLPVFGIVSLYGRVYAHDSMQSYRLSIGRAYTALFFALAILLVTVFIGKSTDTFSRLIFFVGSALAVISLLIVRVPTIWLVRNALSHRFMRKLLIVDGVEERRLDGYDVISARALDIKLDLHDPVALHTFSMLVRGYDRILVDCTIVQREPWSLYLQAIGCIGSLLIPELQSVVSDKDRDDVEAFSICVSMGPLDLRSRILKRLLDLAIAMPLCIVLLPLLLITALAVKLDSAGPVFFKQVRMGRGNRLFYVYKFRSMHNNLSDSEGARSASRDDDRITRVGRVIRATSIDELPQLLNVIEGDMSVVGPRPHALGSKAGNDLFWQVDTRYWLRHSIKPGITGLAQIRGFRGATGQRRDLVDRLHADLEYVRNWSILRDIAILLGTLRVVVHKNAY